MYLGAVLMGAPSIEVLVQPDTWSWAKWAGGILATVLGGFLLWWIKERFKN